MLVVNHGGGGEYSTVVTGETDTTGKGFEILYNVRLKKVKSIVSRYVCHYDVCTCKGCTSVSRGGGGW